MGGRAGSGARGGGGGSGIKLPSGFKMPLQGERSKVTIGNTTIDVFNDRNIAEAAIGHSGGEVTVFVKTPTSNTVQHFGYKAGSDNEIAAISKARKWITSGAKGGQPAKA